MSIQYAPCVYCGNDFQPQNALNCHGCGAGLKYIKPKDIVYDTFEPAYNNLVMIEVTTICSQYKEYVYGI